MCKSVINVIEIFATNENSYYICVTNLTNINF